jgi:hypothetical protein
MDEHHIRDVTPKKEKFKFISEKEPEYRYTCKRCGTHSFTWVQASQHKFGGYGLSTDKLKVCRNCNYAEEISDTHED